MEAGLERKSLPYPGRLFKLPSSKAAASEMPRRTSEYVEALSEARTQLAVVFNNLNKGGDRSRRGY
ncbi:MAG TPA: hypothetical protein VF888_00905 [Nitrospirota bacterium]